MRSIKGPKSALTDFIEESGIKLRSSKDNAVFNLETQVAQVPKRKPKKIQYSKPFEVVNFEIFEAVQAENEIEQMLEDLHSLKVNDSMLRRISVYLCAKRKMSKAYFDFLVKHSKDSLVVFDCSMIADQNFNISTTLKSLELFQCGQLRPLTLNFILKSMQSLEVLRITGAFLIDNFEVPKSIRILDVTNCSRLDDKFIDGINQSHGSLEELRLSYCYGFSKEAELLIDIQRLFICETKLSDKFVRCLKDLKQLSVKGCKNVNLLPNLSSVEYLDVEGIVSLTELPVSQNIQHLNISYCSNIENLAFAKLNYLNVSHASLSQSKIKQIYECKSLEILDVSWNTIVDDSVVKELAEKLRLKKLYVFGCFSLTSKSVELAYKLRGQCLIVGNPSETHYLLNS
ncbi:uncharacterized protein VICG_00125 [Vittaforma corneae ATCC 50505]|uniref:F-box domain-containing protein n=1 Tax=Vittaforma corneae (strain ATCC 50505) TaxID=993615 RepID=L2GQL3_VITCO|nr:uncharacterized protein VICG_00125 [Vittaforma corneae ATCC 50505]ELA42810.1 hypothetical protein VICG_00125 [Vittaforma corneae ATCC 50505]